MDCYMYSTILKRTLRGTNTLFCGCGLNFMFTRNTLTNANFYQLSTPGGTPIYGLHRYMYIGTKKFYRRKLKKIEIKTKQTSRNGDV